MDVGCPAPPPLGIDKSHHATQPVDARRRGGIWDRLPAVYLRLIWVFLLAQIEDDARSRRWLRHAASHVKPFLDARIVRLLPRRSRDDQQDKPHAPRHD